MRMQVKKNMKNIAGESNNAALIDPNITEYNMVRRQIDNAIERMDKYNLQAIAFLSAGAYFQGRIGFPAIILALLVTMFMVLKIFECRNMVAYNVTYLLVFIEKRDQGLYYETRFQEFRGAKKSNKQRVREKKHKKNTQGTMKMRLVKMGVVLAIK